MISLDVQVVSITSNKNGNLDFYGKCEKQLIVFEWGDTGTIEMRKSIENSKCYWSVKLDEAIDLETERGFGANDFEQRVRSRNFDCLGYLTYLKDINAMKFEIFLSKKNFMSFQYLIDKFMVSTNLEFKISTADFIEFNSSNSESKTPTLDDFYTNKLGIEVSDISFTLKNKAVT
jgi:hypothetical protein